MPVHFSLRAFIVEGILGGARVGMARAEIEAILGAPDEWMGDTVDGSPIWRYGLFEVHFDDDVAWLLFTDYLDPPDAGAGRTLDLWILDGCAMTMPDTLGRLHAAGISPEVLDLELGIVARVEGGAELCFDKPGSRPRDPEGRWRAIQMSRTATRR